MFIEARGCCCDGAHRMNARRLHGELRGGRLCGTPAVRAGDRNPIMRAPQQRTYLPNSRGRTRGCLRCVGQLQPQQTGRCIIQEGVAASSGTIACLGNSRHKGTGGAVRAGELETPTLSTPCTVHSPPSQPPMQTPCQSAPAPSCAEPRACTPPGSSGKRRRKPEQRVRSSEYDHIHMHT